MLNWKEKIQAALTLILVGWATPVLSSPLHVLIDIRGTVEVKKTEWKRFNKAESGIILSGEDKIKLSNNDSLMIYCSNKNKWVVEAQGTYLVSHGWTQDEALITLCLRCITDKRRPLRLQEQK